MVNLIMLQQHFYWRHGYIVASKEYLRRIQIILRC